MSSTTQPKDFSDLYTDLINRVRGDTSGSATVTQAKRYINIALQDMHIGFGEKFPWAERNATLRTQPTYSTGTVSISKGSSSLTGSGTAWNTNNDFGVANVRAGGKFKFGGQEIYEVSSVDSDTAITLTQPYIDEALSGATYTYFEDEYDLSSDFLRPLDWQTFSDALNIPIVSRQEFRRRHPRNNIPGNIREAVIMDRAPSGDTVPRRRVAFWQPPNSVELIPYSFVTNKLAIDSSGTALESLSSDDDEPIVPFGYRHVIVFNALMHWYRDKKDDIRSQDAGQHYVNLLQRIVGDQQIGAARPRFVPRHGMYVNRARRPWKGSTGRNFQIGTAWDELRA